MAIPEAAPPAAESSAVLEQRMLAGNGDAGCVLVVDDDPAIRLLCAISLQAEGLRVLEAAGAMQGMQQALGGLPDLVLTDVNMPGGDGFQFAAELRRNPWTHRIPLVFLSAEPRHADRARELGALAYLTKPFDPAAVGVFLAAAVATARADRLSGLQQHQPRGTKELQ